MSEKAKKYVLFAVMGIFTVSVILLSFLSAPSVLLPTVKDMRPAGGEESAAVQSWPVDLNTASKETLVLLDGLSDVLAERIIAYREEHGGFRSVEELTKIKGIGEKRLAAWKPYFYVE